MRIIGNKASIPNNRLMVATQDIIEDTMDTQEPPGLYRRHVISGFLETHFEFEVVQHSAKKQKQKQKQKNKFLHWNDKCSKSQYYIAMILSIVLTINSICTIYIYLSTISM